MAIELWSGRTQPVAPAQSPHRRAREVISTSGGIMRCKFPSRKNGRLVHCEGLLELDAAYLFDAFIEMIKTKKPPTGARLAELQRLRDVPSPM